MSNPVRITPVKFCDRDGRPAPVFGKYSYEQAVAYAKRLLSAENRSRTTSTEMNRRGAGFRKLRKDPKLLVEQANADISSYELLRSGIAEVLLSGEDLPDPARDWLVKHLLGRTSKPKAKAGSRGNWDWKFTIYFAVYFLEGAGLNATRNDATLGGSACDAVAEALDQLGLKPNSYDRVKKIYLEFKRITVLPKG